MIQLVVVIVTPYADGISIESISLFLIIVQTIITIASFIGIEDAVFMSSRISMVGGTHGGGNLYSG